MSVATRTRSLPGDRAHFLTYLSQPRNTEASYAYVLGDISAHPFYLQGKKDGIKDLEEEVIKMAKALFDITKQKAEDISDVLLRCAEENKIVINKFCLKIESWEKISMLILVKLEDYLDDKIDALYDTANQLSMHYNTEKFNWEYIVTYSSESFSMEKVLSEGYILVYEPSPESR